MKTATIHSSRNDFGHLKKADTVQQTKRGQSSARITSVAKVGSLLACMAGTAKVPSDIDEPVGIVWEAMR